MIKIRLIDYFIASSRYPHLEMFDKEADNLWHLFLLDTKEYRKFCFTYFNKIIEHVPYENKKSFSKKDIINYGKLIRNNINSYYSKRNIKSQLSNKNREKAYKGG